MLNLNKELVTIELPDGLNEEEYCDFDSAEGFGGCDQILLDGKVITRPDLADEVREVINRAAKFFSE